jgi:hypothetical protein
MRRAACRPKPDNPCTDFKQALCSAAPTSHDHAPRNRDALEVPMQKQPVSDLAQQLQKILQLSLRWAMPVQWS